MIIGINIIANNMYANIRTSINHFDFIIFFSSDTCYAYVRTIVFSIMNLKYQLVNSDIAFSNNEPGAFFICLRIALLLLCNRFREFQIRPFLAF